MSSTGNVESKPVFVARALQIGLSQACVNLLTAEGLHSFGALAFGCAYTPGTQDETPFLEMVKKAFNRDPVTSELSVMRRLFFESHAVCLQDMRTRIERPTDSTPTRVMPAERAARYDDQVARLVGLKLTGPLEPSHQLIDAVFSLVDENALKYLPIHSLTSRDQEMNGEKEDGDLKQYVIRLTAGALNAKEKSDELRADLGSDLKIRFALQRRALAFDQAALITFETHDAWISLLFYRMSETPPQGFFHVSMEQCLRADRKLFMKMSEACRSNINAVPGQARPLDVAMARLVDHSDVLYLIAPLAHPTNYQATPWKDEPRSGPYEAKGKGKGRPKGGSKGRGKGKKGKGKKGKDESFSQGPPPGCISKTEDGRNICYGFNRPGGCQQPVTAGKCVRGHHICGRANCHGNHPSYDCPSSVQ